MSSETECQQLIDEVTDCWKESGVFTDVESQFLAKPSDEQMSTKCPNGCKLVIYEVSNGTKPPWRAMEKYIDWYRQTRICREHGYARIYLTTGVNAACGGYSLK